MTIGMGWRWLLTAILPLMAAGAAGQSSQAQPAPPRLYAYCSTGDNQWVHEWPPLDGPASIDAMFDWLDKTYHVKRVYWRGEQDRMILQTCEFRREIPLYYEFWTDWMRHLTDEVKTDDLAVAAARRRGMEIYVFDGLFDHYAPGDIGGCGMFPYQCEDKLRLEHPEWCPVDRWGERMCPGPIEFCYPEARQALVSRYVRHVSEYGYNGLGFYTYVENMGVRYADEYGFNDPIVQEFKRRYGVDIRTEPFDKPAWYKLRGEYLTEFLRELHTALAAKGKKLSMTIRPDQPNTPQRWSGIGKDIPGAGMVFLDWETWVKEGIVDELFVWHGGDPVPLLNRMLESCKGKPVELTVFSSSPLDARWAQFREAGVTPVTVTAPGYGIDRIALEPTNLETLKSPDWRLRVQTLTDIAAVAKKKQDPKATIEPALAAIAAAMDKLDTATVAALAQDPHLLVRREAMRTLAVLQATDQVPVLEAGLTDPESCVRIAAAHALASVNGPQTPGKIVAAFATDSHFQMKEGCLVALAAMKEKALPLLIEGARSNSQPVRELCVRALSRNRLAGSKAPLLAVLKEDADYRVRFYAIDGVGSQDQDAIIALLAALKDPDAAVQLKAAATLGSLAGAMSPDPARLTLEALAALLRQYGDGCKRPDAAWGWRPAGNAIVALGEPGKAALEAMRAQGQDKWLAWAAYLVLHAPQDAQKAITCEEKEAIQTHVQYAPAFPGHRK